MDKFMVGLSAGLSRTPYYVLQWVAVAKRGVSLRPHTEVRHVYALVIANMFAQILVFVSSCCNPIIYELTDQTDPARRHSVNIIRDSLTTGRNFLKINGNICGAAVHVIRAPSIIYGLLNDNFRTSRSSLFACSSDVNKTIFFRPRLRPRLQITNNDALAVL